MLLLTSANDKLSVITGSAVPLDVHASWVDSASTVVTPGRTNTAITTAATTVVVAGPGGSTQRNVKTLHMINKHASQACLTTVQHTDSTQAVKLYSTTLNAGDGLEYTDQGGFTVLRKAS